MNILMRYVRYSARKMLEAYCCNISDEESSRYGELFEAFEDTYGTIANMPDEVLDTVPLKDTVKGCLIIVPLSWTVRFICGIGNLFHLDKG